MDRVLIEIVAARVAPDAARRFREGVAALADAFSLPRFHALFARAVDAQAAAALPVFGDDGNVAYVVGIAFAGDRDITDEELDTLAKAARAVRTI